MCCSCCCCCWLWFDMARSRKYDSSVRPVIRAELSEKNRTLRWILIIGFSAIALISFVIGLRAVLVTEPGWEMVESASTEVNVSADFVVSYCYGQTQEDASAEKKRLTMLYSDATEDAYRIFYEGLAPISANVNQPVKVDPALYEALKLVQRYGSRHLYLAPIYAEYNRIFLSPTPTDAAAFDPAQNPELAEYIRSMAAFANDPSMIDLRFLDNHQVQLVVSNEYLEFAQQEEITEFLDFGWMVNAFVADYLADVLASNGFTNGFLSSYDGFTRNLDSRGEAFSLNLFDRVDNSIHLAGTMQYEKPISIVFLRNYPMSQRDQFHYYAFESGRVVSAMLDPNDGMSKSATDSLVGYGYDTGCADILLQLAPIFLSDGLQTQLLNALRADGISAIWLEDSKLLCNDGNLKIELNPEAGVKYTLEYVD